MSIKALVTRQTDGTTASIIEDFEEAELGEGNVTIAVEWSTVNYKDGLALAGGNIMQRYPLIGGIDFAGTVESSENPDFKPGDKVVANGWGLSQTHHGGYAQKAPVPGEGPEPLPVPPPPPGATALGRSRPEPLRPPGRGGRLGR